MGRLLAYLYRDRRKAQSGTTLVELLVSLTIIGFALVIVIGAFSTGLLDATVAKRDTAVEAAAQYELDKVSASSYSASASPYSECFATESSGAPRSLSNFRDPCPNGTFSLRADVSWVAGALPNTQVWTVSIVTWPAASRIGSPISVLKANR
jgi:type II secretory pathway pseudopilin PulG